MTTELTVLFAILGFALLTMPVYHLSGASKRPDKLESDARGKFVLGNFVRSWFYWFIRPIERVSLALGLSPLFYNLAGVALASAGGVAFAMGSMSLGGWGVLAGGAADVLDGRIARAPCLRAVRICGQRCMLLVSVLLPQIRIRRARAKSMRAVMKTLE